VRDLEAPLSFAKVVGSSNFLQLIVRESGMKCHVGVVICEVEPDTCGPHLLDQ
jgi:hypothetical protein